MSIVLLALFPIFSLAAAFVAQAAGLPADLASLLILLAGPAAAVVASRALSRWVWFRSLDASGKLLTVGAVTILISAAATGAQQFLIANPVINSQLDPFVKAALFALTFVSSQVAYGSRAASSASFGLGDYEKPKPVLPITPAQLDALLASSSLSEIAYRFDLKVERPAGVEALAVSPFGDVPPPNPDAKG